MKGLTRDAKTTQNLQSSLGLRVHLFEVGDRRVSERGTQMFHVRVHAAKRLGRRRGDPAGALRSTLKMNPRAHSIGKCA